MKQAFDLTEVRLLLRKGIEAGHWTLEDLDTPSWGWQQNAKAFRLHHPLYVQHEYRNPLRDVPSEPSVEVISPRDFAPQEPPSTEYPF